MSLKKQEIYFSPIVKEIERFTYRKERRTGRNKAEINQEFKEKITAEGLHNPFITYLASILPNEEMYISLRSGGGDVFLPPFSLFALENNKQNDYNLPISLCYSTDIRNIYLLGGLKTYCDEYIERSTSNDHTSEKDKNESKCVAV